MNTLTLTLVVTKSCQLRCKYCYLVGKNPNEVMTLATAIKALNVFHESIKNNNNLLVVFDFIGGEPLLEIDLIDAIMSYINGNIHNGKYYKFVNYEIRITTNGLLYSTLKVQQFIQKYKEQLHISISVDGNEEKNDLNRVFIDGKGSYENIIENVKLWIRQFPNEGTKMTISHSDVPFVFESVKHHIGLGIKKIDANPVVEDVWQTGDAELLEEQLIKVADYIIDNGLSDIVSISSFDQRIGCPVKDIVPHPCGTMTLSVDSNGYFYTCLRFAKFSLRTKDPLIIGDVDKGIDFNKLRPLKSITNEAVYPKKCLDCEISSGCKWCPAESYDSFGSIYVKTTFACDIHKAKVKANNYYWNKLFYSK